MYRIWKEEELVLPRKRPKRRRGAPPAERAISATGPNQVWTYDFVFDRTEDGRLAKILVVVDEGSREFLGERAGRRLDSGDVVEAALCPVEPASLGNESQGMIKISGGID